MHLLTLAKRLRNVEKKEIAAEYRRRINQAGDNGYLRLYSSKIYPALLWLVCERPCFINHTFFELYLAA